MDINLLVAMEYETSSPPPKTFGIKDKHYLKSPLTRLYPSINLTSSFFWHYLSLLLAHPQLTLTTNPDEAILHKQSQCSWCTDSGTGIYVVEARNLHLIHNNNNNNNNTSSSSVYPNIHPNITSLIHSTKHPIIGCIALTPVRVVPIDLSYVDITSDVAKLDFILRPNLSIGIEALGNILLLIVHHKQHIRKVIIQLNPLLYTSTTFSILINILHSLKFKREKDINQWWRFGFGVNEARDLHLGVTNLTNNLTM